jgi:hypothetical protein
MRTTERVEGIVMDRIHRTILRSSVLVVSAVVLSACTSTSPQIAGSETDATAAATKDPSSASSFPIPNGTYGATATRQEELDKGFSNEEITHWYGPDGKQPITIVLDDGTYQVFVVGDDGVKELGDRGTYTATRRQWVATTQSEGCSACVYTFRWSLDGDVLSLKLLSGSAGPADFRDVRLVAEHDYVKAS